MKYTFLLLVFLFTTVFLSAQTTTYVNGYYRQNGTYVSGYYKTTKDNTNHNNYSTTQNINPYTSQYGYVAKDYTHKASHYGSGKTIYIGPKGGKYYINNNGNKVYVPKTF